jgi:hypothetical protein
LQTGVGSNCDMTTTPGSAILRTLTTLDQQNTTLSNFGQNFTASAWAAQTFTPALSGRLTQVDLDLYSLSCSGLSMPNVTVSLRNASGNVPTGSDLAVATISGFCNGAGGLFTASFSSPATIAAGTQYAIVWRTAAAVPPSGAYYATVTDATGTGTASTQDPYAGGRRATSSNNGSTWTGIGTTSTNDHGFAVYVNGYAVNGSLVSSLKDSNLPPGNVPAWTSINYGASAPSGSTLRVQVAGSNNEYGPFTFIGPDGTSGTSFASNASLSQFNGFRYLKYKVSFTSATGAVTATLNDITICYAAMPPAITVNPAGSTIRAGQTASMSVSATNGATYQWYLGASGNTSSPVGGATSANFTTPAVTQATSYWARATNAGGTADSASATVQVVAYWPFADNTLTAGITPIRAVHVTELRYRIDSQRARFGLANAVWTDPALSPDSTAIKAVHIAEMRTALMQAYTAAGMTAVSFTDPSLTAGMPLKRGHIQELRDALVALEER